MLKRNTPMYLALECNPQYRSNLDAFVNVGGSNKAVSWKHDFRVPRFYSRISNLVQSSLLQFNAGNPAIGLTCFWGIHILIYCTYLYTHINTLICIGQFGQPCPSLFTWWSCLSLSQRCQPLWQMAIVEQHEFFALS